MNKSKSKIVDLIRAAIVELDGREFTVRQIQDRLPKTANRRNIYSFLLTLAAADAIIKIKKERFTYFRQVGDVFTKKPRHKVHEVTRAFDRVREYVNKLKGETFTVAQAIRGTGLEDSVVARFLLLGVKRKELSRFGKRGKYLYVVTGANLKSAREPRGAVCEIVFAILRKYPRGISYDEIIRCAEQERSKTLNHDTVRGIVRRWYRWGYVRRIDNGVYALAPHVHERPPVKICQKIRL